MPCVGRGCMKPPLFAINTHGVEFGYCDTHIKSPMKYVGLKEGDPPNDFLKLHALLNSNVLFFKLMKDFTNEVSRAEKKRQGKSTWFNREKVAVKLNYSLSRYEGLCWFGTQPKIMSGLLTAQEFKNAIMNGYMVKDPGPGADHGEYSHRLQWHFIMRVMTDKFTQPKTSDWEWTPLRLYSETIKNADFVAGTGNFWGSLLEGNMNTGVKACAGDPAWVNQQFRDHEVLKTTSFGETLTKRYNRRVAMEGTVQEKLEDSRCKHAAGYQNVSTDPTGRPKENTIKLHAVLEYLYKWKKAGRPSGPPFVAPHGSGASTETDAARIAREAATAERLAAEHLWETTYGKKYANSRQRFHRAEYRDPADDSSVVISEGLLLHGSEGVTDKPLRDRLNASQTRLNPAFKYSSSTGAQRAHA